MIDKGEPITFGGGSGGGDGLFYTLISKIESCTILRCHHLRIDGLQVQTAEVHTELQKCILIKNLSHGIVLLF